MFIVSFVVISVGTVANVPERKSTSVPTVNVEKEPVLNETPNLAQQMYNDVKNTHDEALACESLSGIYQDFLSLNPRNTEKQNLFAYTLIGSLNRQFPNTTAETDFAFAGSHENSYINLFTGMKYSDTDEYNGSEGALPKNIPVYPLALSRATVIDNKCEIVFVIKGESPKLSKENFAYRTLPIGGYGPVIQTIATDLKKLISEFKTQKQKLESVGIDTN